MPLRYDACFLSRQVSFGLKTRVLLSFAAPTLNLGMWGLQSSAVDVGGCCRSHRSRREKWPACPLCLEADHNVDWDTAQRCSECLTGQCGEFHFLVPAGSGGLQRENPVLLTIEENGGSPLPPCFPSEAGPCKEWGTGRMTKMSQTYSSSRPQHIRSRAKPTRWEERQCE